MTTARDAHTTVANLPPETGPYAAILPMAVFAVFACSRQLVAGPDAPISALIGSLLLLLARPDDPRYAQLAFALGLVCAVVFLALWAFKLGFLSRPVLVGFVSGLGVEVFTSQIPKILGISVPGQEWVDKVVGILHGLPDVNWLSVVVGVGTIAIIRILKRLAPGLPGALIAVIAMTDLSWPCSAWTSRV